MVTDLLNLCLISTYLLNQYFGPQIIFYFILIALIVIYIHRIACTEKSEKYCFGTFLKIDFYDVVVGLLN